MKENDVLKLKAAFLYILNKLNFIDQFHLFKILYFADRQHLAKYGRRIIEDTFCAMKDGPVPSNLYDIINYKNKRLRDSVYFNNKLFNTIIYSFETGSDDAYYHLIAVEKPDMDELSISDIECLEESFKENINIPYPMLSTKSHDSAWKKAWSSGRLNRSMDYLDIAEAGGANEDFIHFIKENTEAASCLL